MAQFTVRELQQRLADIAAVHGDNFPVTALTAEARSEGHLEAVAFLGMNGCGKSSIADMLVGGLLPTEDKEEGEIAEEGGPAISRLLLELAGDLAVEDAVEQGRFRLARNPEPRGHPSHLAAAAAAFRGYYKNDRSGFGEPSYLLSIGSSTGSTTQFDVRISHDEVPALLIMPRHPSKLQEMLDYSLGNMIQAVSAVVEEGKKEEDALYDDDFTQNAALFKLLSGIDVLEACGCTEGVLAVLQGLTADSKRQGGLLRAPLAAMKEALVPLLLEGAQENLSSDIWFLRENIGDPVGALLRAAGMSLPELPDDLDGDEGRTLQGLLVEYVHATVPAPGLGSVMLVDKPGLNDDRSLVKYNIAATLLKAKHIILVTNKSLREDSGLVKYLVRVSAWTTAQLAADNPRGTLTVVRYFEKVAPNVQLKKLYNGDLDVEAEKSVQNSRFALLKTLKEGPALPTMPRQDRTARIERFLSSNCSFMSLYPATFLSVALELASDVCAALQAHGVPLSQGYNPQAVVLTLSQKTQMQELLRRIGKLSSFRDLEMIDRLKNAIASSLGAITLRDPADGAMDADGAGPAVQAAPLSAADLRDKLATWQGLQQQLENLTARPTSAHTYVQAIKDAQYAAGSWAAVQSRLSDALDRIRAAAVAQCQGWLADDRIAKAAVRRLKEDGIGLGRLRGILKRDLFRKLRVRDGRPGLVEHIETELNQIVENVFQQHEAALFEAHAAAAESVADLVRHELGRHIGLERLEIEESEWWPHFWQRQLVAGIAADLRRAAQDMFIAPGADDNAMMSRLSRLLRVKMGPKLSAAERAMPKPARPDCWEKVEAAMMDALREVSEELPTQLEALFKFDYLEQAVRVPFFQEVRSTNHLLAVVEMRPAQLNGQPRQLRLAARRAAQPCLWRCIFRFLCAARGAARRKRNEAAAAVAAAAAAEGVAQQQAAAQQLAVAQQQAARQQLLEQLLQELQEANEQLEALENVYRGPHKVELQQRQGSGLAQKMLQRARQFQVDTFLQARRNGIQIGEVYVVGDTLQFDGFAAHRGIMAVPADAINSLGSLQAMFHRLAGRSLYCARKVPGFDTGSALEAAFIAIYRHEMTEPHLRRVYDMVAFEMGCALDRLRKDLDLVPADTETAAYLRDLVDGRAWTSLLELQWLACLLHVNFIIFSALPSPGSRSGRKIAYYIQHRRDMRIGGPMHTIKAYPLAVCLRNHEEHGVRPWFLALHHDPSRTQAAREGQLRALCVNGSDSLQGSPSEVCQVLETMANRAAIEVAAERDAAERAAGGSAAKRRRT